MGINFDFDEIGTNEFDSDCGDDIIIDKGVENNFYSESIYSNGDSVNKPKKVPPIENNEDSKNGMSNNSEEAKLAEQFGTAAVVTEFLFKLFPGRSIFIKEKNL